MGRKRQKTTGYQWVREDQAGEAIERVARQSHREVRQEDAEVGVLAQRLLDIPAGQRAQYPLSEQLIKVLAEHDRIVGAARNRHLRHVKKTLRSDDMATIAAALERGNPEEHRLQELERWRARIIAGDDTDIQAFVETYPETERGTLRALARSARKEAPAGVKASKRLFQYLKTASKPR